MKKDNLQGATWLRCDLHVHTPFDGEKKFGVDLKGAIDAFKKEDPKRLVEIAENFVKACRSAVNGEGIDIVAVTDHNSIEGFRYLKPFFESLAQQAKDQTLPMPTILPGVEFSVGGERPIHFLVVFAEGTDPNLIDNAINYIFGPSDRFDPKNGTPRATGQSVDDFLTKLYEYCRPPSGDRNMEFVVLPAHAYAHKGAFRETSGKSASSSGELTVATSLWDEMSGHLRQRIITRKDWHGFQTSRPFEELPEAFRELLLRWAAARRGGDWEQLSEGQKTRLREKIHWPLVECSDPHNYDAIGQRYTWLKMEVPDVEGIRLSLLDPESRLRRMADGPPTQLYSRIERLKIRKTDFIEDIDINFSPCLTTLIGGRGSGKSTIIEYLRWVLDRARHNDFSGYRSAEIREAVEKILKGKSTRDFGETEGTLLPDYELEIDISVSEHRYRIIRNDDGIRILRDPDTGSEKEMPLDLRSLIIPRILSQRQIARIARDAASQRTELDALLNTESMAEIEKANQDTLDKFKQLQTKRSQLRERQSKLPVLETELQKIKDQITFLEQEGNKDILSLFVRFENERNWLDNILNEIETQAQGLEEQSAEMQNSLITISDVPEDSPTTTWLGEVSKLVLEHLNQSINTLSNDASTLRELAQRIENERAEQWQPGHNKAREKYDELREEMQERGVNFEQHEKLLQQRTKLENDVQDLQSINAELDELQNEIRITHSELVQNHEKRLNLRRAESKTLEGLDADIRIEIIPFRDRKEYEGKRDEWFAGTGLQERDWVVITDYVFASNGSVADRITSLVEAFRTDVEKTSLQGRAINIEESEIAALLSSEGDTHLTGHFYNALEHPERLRLDEMERFLPEDAVEARVRTPNGEFKPITTGSIGQRSTAILSLLLSAGDQPLIIDQPEDDLDNRYVYDVVVRLLRQKKFSRQIIIATHNANIPVNGDAELIIAMGVDEQLGIILGNGNIDQPQIKDLVSVIMEGSAEAFRLRQERYGY